MSPRLKKAALLSLLAIAFLLRYYYAADELRLPPQNPDGYYYHSLAQNMLRGRGYVMLWGTGHEYRLFRPPGYPIFLAAVYSVFGVNYYAVRIIEICISCGSIALIYLITLRTFGKRAAWAAAVIATFYWRSLLWAASFRAENLFIFFFLLVIYFLITAQRRPSYAPVFLGGFFFAAACLVRPNVVFCLPFVIVWFFIKRKSLRAPVLFSAAFILAFIVGFSPWCWYNVAKRRFTVADSFGTTMGAINMWVANKPGLGDELDGYGFQQVNLLRYAHYSMDEKEWIALLQDQTRQFILNSPLRCLKMGLLRFKKHWLAAGVLDGEGTILPDTGQNRYGILYIYKDFWKPGTYFRDNAWVSMEFKKRLYVSRLWIPLLTFEGLFGIFILSLLAGIMIHRRNAGRIFKDMWTNSSLLIILGAGYSLSSLIGLAHHRIRLPIEWITMIYAGWAVILLMPLGAAHAAPPISASKTPRYARLFAALLVVLVFFSITMTRAMRRDTAMIAERCASKPEEKQALSFFSRACPDEYNKIQADLPYREVWKYQMEHAGSIDKYAGDIVCWTGEASHVNEMTLDQIVEEPPPYKTAWEKAGAGAKQPTFILLTIGSYDDPRNIGYGQVLVICDKSSAPSIKEGDRVSVLAEIVGADNNAMGYIVAFGHSLYRWKTP